MAKAAKAAKAAAGPDAPPARLVEPYGPILHFDFVGADTALVVERPWLRVMESFPPALHRHRFGT